MLLCASCDRSGRSAWPELALGLTPNSIKQKYPQTVVSTRIVPGCVQFLGEEKHFYTVWVIGGHEPDACADIRLSLRSLAQAARTDEQASAMDSHSVPVKTGARRICIINLMIAAEAIRA